MADDEEQPGVAENPLPLMYETGPLAPHAGPSDTVSDAPMFVPAPTEAPGIPAEALPPGEMAAPGQMAALPTVPAMGEPAVDDPKAAPGFKYDKETEALKLDLVKRFEANNTELRQIYEEYNKRKNPIYEEILRSIKERNNVQLPPIEPLPAPPSFQRDYQAARQSVLSLGVLFGMFALGSRGRASTTTMLNAFAGVAEGMQRGDKEAATQEMERWKAAMDYTIKANKQSTDLYRNAIEREDMDINTKLETLKVLSAQQGDEVTAKLAEQGNIKAIAGLVEKNEKLQWQALTAELQFKRIEQIVKAADKKTTQGQTATMSEADLNELVDEYHATGRRPQLSVFGFRQAGDANRRAFQALLTERIQAENWGPDWQRKAAADWGGEMAAARSGGTAAGNLDIILRSAEAAIPAAEEASKKVPRGTLVRLNALQLQGKAEISDPKVRDFAIKNLQVAELWARAMNPRGVMRESDRGLALDNLRMSEKQGTYDTALAAVKQFILRERKAVQGFREHTPVQEETPAPSSARTLGGQRPQATVPPAAIEYLKAHPELKADFDSKYGAGAADRALSGQ